MISSSTDLLTPPSSSSTLANTGSAIKYSLHASHWDSDQRETRERENHRDGPGAVGRPLVERMVPKRNPFDWAYNRLIAFRRELPSVAPSPGPRRFAQGLAATLTMIIAVSLLTGRHILALAVEALVLAAVSAILFGGFCFGSFVFHLLTGNAEFARRTLPWGRGA